jgi:hypothetical protein
MPTNYGNGGVFDYGNVLRNVSQIQNRNALTRNELDPNSLQNQLYAAKIRDLNNPASGVDPSGVEKEIRFLQYALDQQAKGNPAFTPEVIDLTKQAIARHNAFLSSGAVNNAATAGQTIEGSKSLGSTQGALLANEGVTSYDPYAFAPSAQMPAARPVTSQEMDLSVNAAMPTKAAQEGKIAFEKAKETKKGAREGELVANKTKTDVMMAEAFGKTEMISGQLQNARRLAGPLTVGWAGNKLSDLAGSQANDLRLELQSIRANAGLDTIRDMKAAGGTVGQVTEAEWPKLESKYAALEQSGSLKEFNRRLDEFEAQYKESLTRLQAAYKQDYGESFNFKKFMSQGQSAPKDESGETYEQRKARILGQ